MTSSTGDSCRPTFFFFFAQFIYGTLKYLSNKKLTGHTYSCIFALIVAAALNMVNAIA